MCEADADAGYQFDVAALRTLDETADKAFSVGAGQQFGTALQADAVYGVVALDSEGVGFVPKPDDANSHRISSLFLL